MKSAYAVLGIPGNASGDEIETAFKTAEAYYSPARLAADATAVDKFLEIKNAYKVLRDAESRAAHDRKLNSQASPAAQAIPRRNMQPVIVTTEPAWFMRPLPALAMVVLLVIGGGLYVNQKHIAATKAVAERELQEKKLAEAALKLEAERVAQEEATKAQLAQKAEQQDRQFRQDSNNAFAVARVIENQRSANDARQARSDQIDERQKEAERRNREQTAAREAQQRLASDKARIRELCMANYRRPDC
ncbi:MAG: DnaJ domain-containing protein [Pseudomonadota bacterium]